MKTLMACGKANSKVSDWPTPQVLFLGFGESSLDFELRVWALDAGDRLIIKSELHQEIDRSFRESGIVIAFPQRDVHLDGTKPVEIQMVSEKLTTDKE
jgi:small-conductance mechanosensitive channel